MDCGKILVHSSWAPFTNDSRFVSAYAQFFFDESDPTRYGINSWNDLKKADISKAAEEKQ